MIKECGVMSGVYLSHHAVCLALVDMDASTVMRPNKTILRPAFTSRRSALFGTVLLGVNVIGYQIFKPHNYGDFTASLTGSTFYIDFICLTVFLASVGMGDEDMDKYELRTINIRWFKNSPVQNV